MTAGLGSSSWGATPEMSTPTPPVTRSRKAGESTGETAEEAFASLGIDAERLVDEIQANRAPQAEGDLLERCRDVLESIREAESESADRVDEICDRIHDADVDDAEVWNTIRQEIDEVQMR